MIDATNRNMALASALAEELSRSGVRRAFLSPGSRSSPVALALDREPGIDVTVVLDERSAGFAALGASLASGTPAVVACTSGSAAANLHPSVVEADQAGVAMIVLTSDRPPELRGIGAGQTIDQIGLYGGAVRWFSEVGTHDADDRGLLHLRATACRAMAESASGRGPVHLNLAWRDPLGPEPRPGDVTAADPLALGGRSQGRPLTTGLAGREPAAALVDAVAGAVGSAARGLIVAGRLPDRSLVPAIVALAERTGFPVLADATSQLRFGPHDRGSVVTAYDLIVREPGDLTPDLVLRFGDLPTSKPLRLWLRETAADQVVIDPPGRWNEPSRIAGALVRADAAATVERLLPLLPQARGEHSAWLRDWLAAEQSALAAAGGVIDAAPGLTEPGVQRALEPVLREGDRVMVASSMPIRDAEAFLPGSHAAVTIHSNRGANGIDGLVSTAAGIGLGSGDPVWLVLGDLALAHDVGGLAIAAAVGSPLRIVVIDNGGGGIFDFLPQAGQVEPARFAELFTTPSALDVATVAGAYGIPYERVDDEQGLRALADRDLVLGHVVIDREGNVDLHREIAAAVAAAID